MATGWAGDNAVNEQIDATVKDGIRRAQSRVPQDRRRAGLQYPAYAFASPAKRVTIGTPPIFPATTAAAARTANCASSNPRCQIASPPSNRSHHRATHRLQWWDPLTGSRRPEPAINPRLPFLCIAVVQPASEALAGGSWRA